MTERPFRTVSLGDWLKLAAECGTPHVPATRITSVRVADLMHYDVSGPHEARLKTAWDAMAASRRPGTMLRWDCCASAELKHLMAQARQPANEERQLQTLMIDERICELAGEYPGDEIAVWQRPWIRDRMIMVDGYPVEYRAFIRRGVVTGISNYYPQRPLRERYEEIGAVKRLAGGLAEALAAKAPLARPYPLPGHSETPHETEWKSSGRAGVHATADFIVTSDGETLLLDGGPPHFAGAHPCCFEGRGSTDGVALSRIADGPARRDSTARAERA